MATIYPDRAQSAGCLNPPSMIIHVNYFIPYFFRIFLIGFSMDLAQRV